LLEEPCVFNKASDELYELDREAFDFLLGLAMGSNSQIVDRADKEFLDYCLDEGIVVRGRHDNRRNPPAQSPLPSLRYLLLHITTRCNLRCAHCFHGDTEPLDLPVEHIAQVMEQFDDMQGLRLLISGGEPLLHPRFREINKLFDRFSFRTVILSNGTIFEELSVAPGLRAHEVQVSLDGVGASHDILRGPGSYKRALAGLKNLCDAGVDVSISTMVHSGNLSDFDALESIVKSLGAKEWGIDVPARAGRWLSGASPEASPEEAAPLLGRAYGGGAHSCGGAEWACGAHLCAVMADGTICKCGYYADSPVGALDDGLLQGWQNVPRVKVERLRCDCDMLAECKGGCRYRAQMAGQSLGKDPVMCAANGLSR
jgi:radical SAM protein with 4Fe4S-binding SPASM domain